jgi:uncharacterized protein YndB with AHSA1/START domain
MTAAEAIREGDIPGVQLRRRQLLALPAEAAWAWLTEAGKLARWLAERAEAHPDGSLTLAGSAPRVDPPKGPWQERIRTVAAEAPRLWVATFERLDAGWTSATRLTVRLQHRPSGCEADVLQQGFERLSLSVSLTVWESYRTRWRTALARLAELAA